MSGRLVSTIPGRNPTGKQFFENVMLNEIVECRETAVIRECFPTSVLLGSIERPVEPQVDH